MKDADQDRTPAGRFEAYLLEVERDPVFQIRQNRIEALRERRPIGTMTVLVVGAVIGFGCVWWAGHGLWWR